MTDEGKNFTLTVQGEHAKRRSQPSLYARYDRSSSLTDPYSVTNTILNYIGGDPWTHPGEWIEWDFEVPEDGFYNISIKARQIYQRGALSARTVYIDGVIPFEDLEAVPFGYNTSWEMRTLSDENGKPFRFYLTKGAHTIRMEVTMGKMGEVLKQVEDSIFRLNQIYTCCWNSHDKRIGAFIYIGNSSSRYIIHCNFSLAHSTNMDVILLHTDRVVWYLHIPYSHHIIE